MGHAHEKEPPITERELLRKPTPESQFLRQSSPNWESQPAEVPPSKHRLTHRIVNGILEPTTFNIYGTR